MSMDPAPMIPILLIASDSGAIRGGETRVRLETVIYAFNEGYTAKEIVVQYPSLTLLDVYAVIALASSPEEFKDQVVYQPL